MVSTKEILNILPGPIRNVIDRNCDIGKLEEIRIKVNKPLIVYSENKESIFEYKPSEDDLKNVIQRISNYSIYAFENELKQGYITIKGGHRVGLCGSCIIENNTVKTIKDFASINIRISKEVKGCSDKVVPYIISREGVMNTIVISPPLCGKTTLLRDIARNISEGQAARGIIGRKVCVIDERSEISACYNGVPQMNVGMRTDVLDNCPKSSGIMMAIRSMSPNVIVCDEIGTDKDMTSIIAAVNSGVNIISSIHGYSIEDFISKLIFKDMVDNKIFKRAVVLSASKGAGTVEYIYSFETNDYVWRRQDA